MGNPPNRLQAPGLEVTIRAIEAKRAVLVLPLPFGRYEVRTRDAGWLELEAARL